jgi:predicted nuclease of predicted toxin-antitoxin system
VRIVADLNIAPRTVSFLRSLGHDVVRVNEVLPATSSDLAIVEFSRRERRAILTQDLDLSAIVALSGERDPSVITLRLASPRIDTVNSVLEDVLARLEDDIAAGVIATVEDGRVRLRSLPFT